MSRVYTSPCVQDVGHGERGRIEARVWRAAEGCEPPQGTSGDPAGLESQDWWCGTLIRMSLISIIRLDQACIPAGPVPTASSHKGNYKEARKLPFSDFTHYAKDPKWEIKWGSTREMKRATGQRELEGDAEVPGIEQRV